MIRIKAKNLLLSIALVMMCFCFFACKETKVEVESISFTEQSISMLVGEEYSPDIKILPSYATDRSYTLISDNVAALKVEGGTITALKAVEGGVKLKVVSKENSNINDIITVNIYTEAINLKAPTNLAFDGDKLSFESENDISVVSYKLKIGEQEIDIGNNTEYSLNSLVAKLGNLNNEIVTCRVKSMGDGKIFKDSNYSEEISFVKLSGVDNAYIKNETLYFDAIKNVASYNIDVLVNGNIIKSKLVQNSTFKTGQLSLDIRDLTDSVNGAEYILNISPNVEGYNSVKEVDVFAGETTQLDYVVLGKVNNLNINESVLSWDFVKNAQSYTIELYKNGSFVEKYEKVIHNYLNLACEDAGMYYCQVIANSNNPNTTSGKEYSNKLNFEILDSPEISLDGNIVGWENIAGAEGYLVTIKNNLGTTLVNKKFVLKNIYDVSGFDAGVYSIEVMACGNGQNLLSSKTSTYASWVVLHDLQLKIKDKKLYWTDEDVNSLNKYNLKFDINSNESVDVVLTSEDYNEQYSYNAEENVFVYDLSSYNFEPNSYTISLQSIGDGAVFDAEVNTLNIIKLSDSSILGLSNKQFTIKPVSGAINYKIMIYNSADLDLTMPIITLETMLNGNKFNLDDSLLGAGKYKAKVFASGNGTTILDADNSTDVSILQFEKLATPKISIDEDNLKIIIEEISNASGYKLFENSSDLDIQNREYSLNTLDVGEYVYTAQAMGDNATVLDSVQTLVSDAIKIKKLSTPTILFDKTKLTYTISTTDGSYVDTYNFTLNGTSVQVVDGQVDCSSQITNAGDYCAQVYANPISDSEEYHLIIKSNLSEHNISKLAGDCDFEIANGKLVVTPKTLLDGSGYALQVRIENGDNDIIIDNFEYGASKFEVQLYDDNYDILNENIATLLQNPTQYKLFATILQNQANIVESNEVEISNNLSILNRVNTIVKNGEAIEFNVVENATNYIAVVKLDNVDYYVDLAGKYTTNTTKNILDISSFMELMETSNLEYKEGEDYSISFVATSEDSYTMANKGIDDYIFQFLKSPKISVVELEGGNVKYVAIENDDMNVSMYNAVITQGQISNSSMYIKSNEQYNYINLDEMEQFNAGDIKIEVKSVALNGDYFASKYSNVNVVKLDSAIIKIVDGLLQWDEVGHAKQYNLAYTVEGVVNYIDLYEGVENFTIEEGKCVYNFDSLESGLTDIYLQVDSELESDGKYYINSNNGQTFANVYKLPTLEISVENGQICTEIRNSDLVLTDSVKIMIDGNPIDIDITKVQDDISIEVSVNKTAITINPVILLKYGSTELLKENISLQLYSNNETTLNSSVGSKDVYGLLAPSELGITTSTKVVDDGVIDEVFEKITWINPKANNDYVLKYEIIITYDEKDYVFESVETTFMMPTYYDDNGNGKFDEGEVEFGEGEYAIKVRALTDNYTNIVNSKYCEEITVIVLDTPTDLSTKNGNVIWSTDINAEYYLIKVYLLKDEEKTLIVSSQSKISEFDLCNLKPFDTGVYGITVQAMHNNSRILASKESEILQAVRLPQVESYFVKDGELYINAHSFYTKAEIVLTDKQSGARSYFFEIENKKLSAYEAFVEGMEDWLTSTILDTYTDEDYFVKAKYVGDQNDSTLRTALAEAYSMQVKLYGNSAIKGAILSGHSNEVANLYWEDNNTVPDKNSIEKLVTPTIDISAAERGMLLLSIPNGLNYSSLTYYVDGENALRGVHLYEMNIKASKQYKLYIAQVIDEDLLTESLNAIGSSLIQDDAEQNNLKHFEYNGHTFNVIDVNQNGYIPFNFNVNYYYYYTIEGLYSLIDLSSGGSFVVSVKFLGDDTQFVKSNLSESATIKRYKVLNLTINNGTMSWLNQATGKDHPIYLVTLTNANETYNLVLYNPNIYSKEDLTGCLDASKTYIFDTITYVIDENIEDEYITYTGLANIIEKARLNASSELVGTGGVFLASVQAHYTDSSSMDIILAQGAESKTIALLPQTEITVNNGVLTWDLAYVTNTGGQEYIYNYLLQVFDENNNKLYEVDLKSGNYTISNYVAAYELPKQLSNGEDDGFTFVTGSKYKFSLIALAGDSATYINSIATSTNIINLLPDLQDVRMENGVLNWTNSTSNAVEVRVSYVMGDATILYITKVNDNSFELPQSFIDTNGTSRQFISGYNYSIKIRLQGNNASLNGFFSEEIVTQRLATIKSENIVTNNGVLTWTASDVQGVKYSIKYTLSDLTTNRTELLGTNSFDFADLPSGVISLQITSHHNEHFSSFISDVVNIYKLATPTNIKFNEGTTTISWDKVVDNNGIEVTNYIVSIRQDGAEDVEYKCSSNKWVITGVTSNSFSIAVKAVSVEERGVLINSDYTSYQSMKQPKQVDGTTFKFDEKLQVFKWKAIDDETEGDKYYIAYSYFAPNSETAISSDPIEVTNYSIIEEENENVKYYYYQPSVIGRYALIYVQVVRAGSLASQPTYCVSDEGNYVLDFNLFTSGNGVDKPYIISNEEQLRNIKYFLNANYELEANIALSSNEPITNSEQVFTGTINGNSKYIYGAITDSKVLFSNTGYVGLFNNVAGATFIDIQLSGFKLNGYLNSQTLYMGILVGRATGLELGNSTIRQTIFNNIVVASSSIMLTKDNQNGYISDDVQMYVGSIAGYAENAKFTNCRIKLGNADTNIHIWIKGDASTEISLGGVVGYASNCEFTNNQSGEGNIAFVIQYTLTAVYSYAPIFNLGAIVGKAHGDNVVLSGNSCEYIVYSSQGNITNTNEIGSKS